MAREAMSQRQLADALAAAFGAAPLLRSEAERHVGLSEPAAAAYAGRSASPC